VHLDFQGPALCRAFFTPASRRRLSVPDRAALASLNRGRSPASRAVLPCVAPAGPCVAIIRNDVHPIRFTASESDRAGPPAAERVSDFRAKSIMAAETNNIGVALIIDRIAGLFVPHSFILIIKAIYIF